MSWFFGLLDVKGKTKTKNTSDTIIDIATQTSAQTITECGSEADVSQKQKIVIKGKLKVGGDISQNIIYNLSSNCAQKAELNVKLLDNLKMAILQVAKSKGTDVTFGTEVDAENKVTITQSDKSKYNFDNIVREIHKLKMEQEQDILVTNTGDADIGGGIIQNIDMSLIQEAVLNVTKTLDVVRTSAIAIDNTATAETKGTIASIMDGISDMFSAATLIPIIFIIIVGLVLMVGAWGFFKMFSGPDGLAKMKMLSDMKKNKIEKPSINISATKPSTKLPMKKGIL